MISGKGNISVAERMEKISTSLIDLYLVVVFFKL